MTSIMNESNSRLADTFEMLVERMGGIEDTLKKQQSAARYADSKRKLGDPFLGINLCGLCIELNVHSYFDINGVFTYTSESDFLVLVPDQDPTEEYNAFYMPDSQWIWDADLRSAWGPEKYESVRAKMTRFENDLEEDGYLGIPSCQELGMVSDFAEFYLDCYDTVLRRRVPGLLAVGSEGFAVTLSDIAGAVHLSETVFSLLGQPPSQSIQIYRLPAHMKPLALAILKQHGIQEAWRALSDRIRKTLITDCNGHNTFFNQYRLHNCL